MHGGGRVFRCIISGLLALALLGGTARAESRADEQRPDRVEQPPDRGPDRAGSVPASPAGDADLDRVNPGIGFGWFGLSDIPVGPRTTDAVEAPVIGIRWWMGAPLGPFRTWGIDLGLGLARRSTDASPRNITRTGLLLHAGLPLAVSAAKHVAIVFVPELNLGFASGQDAAGTDVGGSRFDVGARAGAEVFFGFVGLPQLSLEGSVGIYLSRETRSARPPGAAEARAASVSFGTAHFNDPWDFFRTGVAARYYF